MSVRVKADRFVVDAHGRPQAVILSFVNYQKLMRLVEDQADARTLQRAKRTARSVISHSELVERLKREHLI